jgi:hypothetical protein
MTKLFPILTLLILLWSCPAFAQSPAVPAQFVEFTYHSNKKDLFSYTDYLRNLERRAIRLIRFPRQQLQLKIQTVPDFPEGFKESAVRNTYWISDNLERLYYDYALNMKLIETVLLARCGFRPDELRTPYPLWLVTAVYSKLHPEQSRAIPVPKRPGLQAFAAAGEFPQAETALLNPIRFTGDGPAAYFLFEELCGLVLDFGDTFPGVSEDYHQMAQLCRDGAAPEAVLAATFRKRVAERLKDSRLGDSEKMQALLEAYARDRLVNQLQPYTSEQTMRQLDGILTFRYEAAEGDQTVERQARLERLPHLLGVAVNRDKLLRDLTVRLNDLSGKSFYLVAEELKAIGRIIIDAGLGTVASPQTLSEQLQRHLNNLMQALERQHLIEQRLRELEIRRIPPADYYKNEFQEIRSFKPIFPEAEALLDKYEKELREFH